MRLHCASALLLALLLSAGSNATAQGSTCTAQLAAAAPSATTKFIDPNTPSSACTLPLCTGNNFASCNPPAAGAQRNLQLVFSDEFNQAGRPLGVEANDTRWTADNLWYAGTDDMEVYRSEQVTTAGGAAVITMEKGAASGPVQRDNGTVWNVTKDYKSSFFSSWNKSCGRHSGSWCVGGRVSSHRVGSRVNGRRRGRLSLGRRHLMCRCMRACGIGTLGGVWLV